MPSVIACILALSDMAKLVVTQSSYKSLMCYARKTMRDFLGEGAWRHQ